jgi:hypothetical protein
MKPVQLSLWDLLAEAQESPRRASLPALYAALEENLAPLSPEAQLLAAGRAFLAISSLIEERAAISFRELEEKNSADGPPISEDLFLGLVRNNQELDWQDLLESPQPEKLHYQARVGLDDSVVGEVPKEQVLQMLEAFSAEPVITAHDEDIPAWSKRILSYFEGKGFSCCSFLELEKEVGLPRVELWLGLLHCPDNIHLEQTGDFYDTGGISVKAISQNAKLK